MIKNKRIWAITGLVVFLIILLVINLDKPKRLSISKPLAGNIQHPYYEDGNIYFFTGSSFALYNTKTHSTTRLSGIYHLPDITDVKISKNGALFKATSYTGLDDLYKILVSKQLSTEGDYWWYVDFQRKSLNLLETPDGSSIPTHALWHSQKNDTIVFYTVRHGEDLHETTIFEQKLGGHSTTISTLQTPAVKEVVWADSKSFIFESSEEGNANIKILKINLASKNSTKLLDDMVGGTTSNPEGSFLSVYKFNRERNADAHDIPLISLYGFDVAKKDLRLVQKNFSGNTSWSKACTCFISTAVNGKKQEISIFEKNGEKEDIELAQEINTFLSVSFIENFDELRIWSVDERGDLFLLGSGSSDVNRQKKSDEVLRGDFYENGFNINYLPKPNQYNIYITNNPYSQNQVKALDFIKSRGIDPNQIYINWYAYDNVDRSK